MKVIAFGASSSRQSINKRLVSHAVEVLKAELIPEAEIELLDLNDFEMPLYSIDREREAGIPDAAQRFLSKVRSADALLIAFAEHNGSYTVAYKNIFDWCSRIQAKVYQDKTMVLLSTSIGRNGGKNVLALATTSVPHFGAEVKASLAIPSFNQNFDTESNELKDSDLQAQLRSALQSLRA